MRKIKGFPGCKRRQFSGKIIDMWEIILVDLKEKKPTPAPGLSLDWGAAEKHDTGQNPS